MKKFKPLAFGSILVVVILAWANYATPKTNESHRWEYKIVYTASEDELNRLGGQGWEVATAYGSGSTAYCILKRSR